MQPVGFLPNERDVAIIKRNSTVIERKQTKLYFVGIELVQALNGASPVVYVKGQPFQLPALGESVTVDEVVAKDLIDKTRWSPDRSRDAVARDVLIREEQGGAQMAKMIKDAIAKGTPLEELNLYGVQKQSIASGLTNDELIDLLQKRGLSVTVDMSASETEGDEKAEAVVEEAEKPVKSSKAKVNKAVPQDE